MIDVIPNDSPLGDSIHDYHAALQEALDRTPLGQVEGIARAMLVAYDRGGRVLVCGNGGSAATATHMACDLAKNTAVEGVPRLRAHALTDNAALIMALANDLGYDTIFAEQLLSLPVGREDLVVAISGSGNSANVLAAIRVAREAGARTVGLTGMGGGRLAGLVDAALVVPSNEMEIVEDVHLAVNHMLTRALRLTLLARAAAGRTLTHPAGPPGARATPIPLPPQGTNGRAAPPSPAAGETGWRPERGRGATEREGW